MRIFMDKNVAQIFQRKSIELKFPGTELDSIRWLLIPLMMTHHF